MPMPPVVVPAEDVINGKPDPEGYLRAASLLGREPRARPSCSRTRRPASSPPRSAGAQVVVVGSYDGPAAEGLPRIPDFTAASCRGRRSGEIVITLDTA